MIFLWKAKDAAKLWESSGSHKNRAEADITPDEAQDAGRYLMIGAAEHGFIDTQRNLALICESDLWVSGWRVAARIPAARSTRIR